MVSKIAELGEVVMFAGIDNYSNDDASPLGRIERVQNRIVRDHVGCEVDRSLRAGDQLRVDCVEGLFWRIVELLRQRSRNGANGRRSADENRLVRILSPLPRRRRVNSDVTTPSPVKALPIAASTSNF